MTAISRGERDGAFICPFYERDRGLTVYCEGGCRVSLPDRQSFGAYVGDYCAALPGWRRCTLARAREAYYDRQG